MGRLRYGSQCSADVDPEKKVEGEGIQEYVVAGQLVQAVLFGSGLYVAVGHARHVDDPLGGSV